MAAQAPPLDFLYSVGIATRMTLHPHATVRNGWTLYKYVLFGERYDSLEQEVEALRQQDAEGYVTHPKTKILARVNELIFDEIPADPADPKYRQGKTLGVSNKDWFRAKFLSRFRLFFRFDSRERIIIYCWVNDENTLRKAGSSTDPYKVFAKMIKSGQPPGTWDELKTAVIGAADQDPQSTSWR